MSMSTEHNSPPSPLIRALDISYTYPNGTPALQQITLDVEPGERIALLGRNGAGKSTLVRHLNGILPLQKGELLYEGREVQPHILPELRQRVGILFQDPDNHLFSGTLYDDVAFGPMNQGIERTRLDDLVMSSLTTVGLEHLAYKPAHKLSYGQKKRAAFAAILAMEPEVLILDEPTANLDPRQEKIFMDILNSFAGTLIIIDHDLLFLYRLCNRAVVLSKGKIQHDFSMKELVSDQQTLREHGLDFNFRFTCCGNHAHSPDHHHHHHHHPHEHSKGIHHLPHKPDETLPLLEMQHYSFTYPDNSPGIRDINLSIGQGESIALIGENGAGKSTLASCLMGLNPGEGYLLHKGRLLRLKEYHRLPLTIGMVFQHSADQLFCPTCHEEVAFGPLHLGLSKQEIKRRVEESLNLVGLEGYEERVPLDMSGGERKRLAIAAVLAMEPELLILDEPTPSLDPIGEETLLSVLQNLPQAKLLISHDLFFISRLTHRTVVMHQGRIVRDYLTGDFLQDDHLQAVNGLDYTFKNSCFAEIEQLRLKES